MRLTSIAIVMASVLALSACGSESAPTRTDIANRLVNEGWVLFAAEDYTGALQKFDEALDELSEYPDAVAGRGWALAFLGSFAEARLEFVLARELSGLDADIWAGGAFVYAALEDHDQVVVWAESALTLNSSWEFTHRPSINSYHLNYVLAVAYWYRGSYHQCRQQVDILEPGVVHTTNPQTLLADLQRLFASPFS